MSLPERKSVSFEELAWMAKTEEEEAIDGSRTVTTLGNIESVMEIGETASIVVSFISS